VFKVQFDSRKIVCASVDPRIVGWDFACGDEEILEACQFFRGL
jgi:F-box and WD-40 domain protein 1/11